jgi:hypothetical protein
VDPDAAACGAARRTGMTETTRAGILLVAGRTLLLLPVCLAFWYFASTPLSWIAGKAATPIIRLVADAATMEVKDRSVVYEVTLEKPYGAPGAPRAVAEVEVLAPKFTYGIALFLALCFAAKESRRRVVGIIAGCAVLTVLPALGIACDALKELGAVSELQPFVRWADGTREAIALGYQVGTLLLPPLAPVALWLALARPLWDNRPGTRGQAT